MAVPQAVQQRMQREQAELAAQGIDPNGPPPGAPVATGPAPSTPMPTSAPLAPAAPTEDVAALRARNAELEAELRTQSGRVSATASELAELKSRFEVIGGNRSFLETSVTELNERNAALEAELAELRQKGNATQLQTAASALDEAGPTPEQLKEFGDSVDFVQRVVKKELASIVKPLLADIAEIRKQLVHVKDVNAKLPKIEETVKIADINNARAKEEQFLNTEVLPHFPDFPTVRTTQEWKDYLSKDTGRGYQIGMLLKTYRQQNDANGIRSIIGAFYEQRKAKPSLDALAVPGKTTADVPEAPAPAKMKASEYKANLRAFTMKRMPAAQWNEYRARWEQALQQGNVEMDVELR